MILRHWHLADNPTVPAFVRYWSNGGQEWASALTGWVANDPAGIDSCKVT